MESKSLRAITREFGVSASYLSQVKNGKKKPSKKLLSKMDIKVLTKLVNSDLSGGGALGYNEATWRRSSVVEQGTHKPLVTGPNPVAATFCF